MWKLLVAVAVFLAVAGTGEAAPLQLEVVAMDSLPAKAESVGQRRPDMLPDGVVARGTGNIRAAWLTGPTDRYAHGVLGDAIEASGLAVELADGRVLSLTLEAGAVFEDRVPRLVDLDGDGRGEVLVVKSTSMAGAALAVAGIVEGGLVLMAEGRPIGRPFRWLNPVGVGDFDGDGRIETAHVETPHIGGTLVLSRLEGGRLVAAYRTGGFSNHRMGSRELGLSAVLDADGDGVPDLIVPDNSRKTLRIVTFAGGRFRELGRATLPAEVISALRLMDIDGDGRADVAFRMSNGKAAGLLLRPYL